MIEVFFAEAAKYSLKLAKQEKNNSIVPSIGNVLFIGPHLDIEELSIGPNSRERQESL